MNYKPGPEARLGIVRPDPSLFPDLAALIEWQNSTANLRRNRDEWMLADAVDRGDGTRHIGPPAGLSIPTWSQLWSTRCGLGKDDGPWFDKSVPGENIEEPWCLDCLRQAGFR